MEFFTEQLERRLKAQRLQFGSFHDVGGDLLERTGHIFRGDFIGDQDRFAVHLEQRPCLQSQFVCGRELMRCLKAVYRRAKIWAIGIIDFAR